MPNYDFSAIEKKWHQYWEENNTFATDVWDFSQYLCHFFSMAEKS